MNIPRNTVTEFHYASTAGTTKENIIEIGTANANRTKKIKITDLKATGGASGAAVKFYVDNYSTGNQTLEFDVPANESINFSWEVPYPFTVVSSSGEERNFVSSADGSGVKYSISGYIE